MPAGRRRNSGFYRPLELFYSRRIGRKLPDGSEVPLLLGTKAFGRVNNWEYGGFLAMTGEKEYESDGEKNIEDRALFSSVRIRKQILENSQIGMLYVGKNTKHDKAGVIDIDGAFRSSDWQLCYQFARSYKSSQGDYAGSIGFLMPKEKWIVGLRSRYIGENFDINEVGFVPWSGTGEFTLFNGPRWYFEEGYISNIFAYFGGSLNYEHVDHFTDRVGVLGFNMQFRRNWGWEITLVSGLAKEEEKKFTSTDVYINMWVATSPKWRAFFSTGLSKTYNFSREYLAYYSWVNGNFQWRIFDVLNIGSSLNVFIEANPQNQIEDITINSRPFFSLTPVNNLKIRLYLDNVYLRSSDRLEQLIGGLLFSYNFRPKSWVYLAINEVQDRSDEFDHLGNLLPNRLHVTDRASVVKLKYLFYF